MTIWGVCDNANFSESLLTTDDMYSLRFQIRRTIVLPELSRQLQVINSARRLGDKRVKTLVVYTTQSSGTAFLDYDGYCAKLNSFLDLADGTVYGIEIQNELDTPDWGISDDEIVEIAKRGAEVCHNHGVKAFAPSLLSGPEEGRFEYIAQRIHNDVDYMSVHPYYCSLADMPWTGWHFGTVEAKAEVCAQLCPWIPTAFTEWGCPVGYDGIAEWQQAQAAMGVKAFEHPSIYCICMFCRDDSMVPGFELYEGKAWGLMDTNGQKKESYRMLEATVPTFAMGFKEWHDLEPERIGEAIEDEHGGIDGYSQQLTTNGLLTWADVATHSGGIRTFYEFDTLKRFYLPSGATESMEL